MPSVSCLHLLYNFMGMLSVRDYYFITPGLILSISGATQERIFSGKLWDQDETMRTENVGSSYERSCVY